MEKNIIYSYLPKTEDLIIPRKEILRYMGCRDEDETVSALIERCITETIDAINPKGSFGFFDITKNDSGIYIDKLLFKSKDLSENLDKCSIASVFSLTLGTEIDFIINKYQNTSPATALCINSVATAAIEVLADKLCSEISENIKAENLYIRPRFSAGYGDFSIEYQGSILNLVNASKLNGIYLTDALMMVPIKSITAIAGISRGEPCCRKNHCEGCKKINCNFRR